MTPPTGPYRVKGATLPADALPVAKDLQTYIDSERHHARAGVPLARSRARPWSRSPSAVGVRADPGPDGAAQYDQDVEKQAKQLGLAGW